MKLYSVELKNHTTIYGVCNKVGIFLQEVKKFSEKHKFLPKGKPKRGSLSGSISRVLYPLRGDNHSSRTSITTCLKRPTRKPGASHTLRPKAPVFLFGLAPDGVYLATNGYPLCGALLPHPFTLTCDAQRHPSAVYSLLH